jgi:hypothetical protein
MLGSSGAVQLGFNGPLPLGRYETINIGCHAGCRIHAVVGHVCGGAVGSVVIWWLHEQCWRETADPGAHVLL